MTNNRCKNPPRLAEWILGRLYRDRRMFTSVGDFREEYLIVCQSSGFFKADLWYWKQIAKSIPSFIRNKGHWSTVLLYNYFKIAVRNFRRHKIYSLINIFGLALGMACSILIFFYIHHELRYDRFHENADCIFRIKMEGLVGGNSVNMAITPSPLGPALVNNYPEVLAAARIRRSGTQSVRFSDKEFLESGIVYADPSLFEVFTFPLIKGDIKIALERPYTVILTESTAEKYFGKEDPIGKFLNFDNQSDFSVVGIVKDIPHKSHLGFDLVCSLETDFVDNPEMRDNWFGPSSYFTYIRLDRPQAREPIEVKLHSLIDEKMGEAFREMKVEAQFHLQSLTDIHLRSKLQFEFGSNGDILNIYIFAAIALIILSIACINFMNLATARSACRAREVGMRKVVGAHHRNLIGQFLGESIGLSLIALLVGSVFVKLALPLFKSITGIELTLGANELASIVPMSIGLALFIGIVAGSYPAFYLSAFQPVNTLRGSLERVEAKPGKVRFRRFLVVGQFTLAIFMISGTLTIENQIRYMKNKDMGFQKNQVLAIRTSDENILRALSQVKSRLKRIPGVIGVSAASLVPGQGQSIDPVVPEGFAENETARYRKLLADADYVRTMGMKIVEGRDFSIDVISDVKDSILINETAVRTLGWDDPIGKTMKIPKGGELFQQYSTKTIVGVVQDFHYSSLRNRIEPLYISNELRHFGVLAIRITTNQTGRIVEDLKEAWKTISPGSLFNYFFVDDLFDAHYRFEERLNKIFSSFSLVAIAIACLGLFGLASFMVEQRKKEISIRKVLGATSSKMVGLLCRDFLKLVILSALIAWPIAYLAMNFWLREFANRTSINLWTFVLSGLAALAIALLAVSYQAVRAASAHPADTLKHE